MDLTRLEPCAYINIVVRGGPPRDSTVWKGIVPHGLDRLNVTFSNFSPSQYSYFDVSTSIQINSHSFCMTLDLQLSFYCPLCYNSRAHCPLLQCLYTTSIMLAGTHYYFVVSSFNCGKKKIVAMI